MPRVHIYFDSPKPTRRSTRRNLFLFQLVAEAIESIDITKQASLYQRKITSLVIFKGQIFYKLGYLENAYQFFTNVQTVIAGSPDSKQNDFESILHMPYSQAVDYLECALGIIAIDIELSRFDLAERSLKKCSEVVDIIFRSKDSDMNRRVKILWLNLAKDKLNFEMRNQIADDLSNIYQNYDHYRLLRCEDFMQFVKERIIYLIDDCKHDSALVRVENILTVLDEKKTRYWYDQFRILLAKCLITLRKPQKAYEILQDILHNRVIRKDEAPKMKDYRLFVDIHLQLGSTR